MEDLKERNKIKLHLLLCNISLTFTYNIVEDNKEIMTNEITLRDRLAMSMPTEALPEMEGQETIEYMADKFGLEWSDDPIKQIEFAFAYQAIIRYQYADAMLKARGEK